MKTRLFISLLVVAMGVIVFSGCQKRSSCNGGIQGHLEVLDEPYETDPNFFYVSNVKVTANFYDSNNRIYFITGKVPKKISHNSLVTAKIHVVDPGEEYDSKPHYAQPLAHVYKLDCICIDEE